MRWYKRDPAIEDSRWVSRFAWARTRLMQYGHEDQPVGLWMEPYFRFQLLIDGQWRDTCEAVSPGHPYLARMT